MEYVKKNWQNTPSTNTPINADNLNHIEQGIYDAQSTANAAQELASETEAKLDALQARETTSTAAGMTDTTKAYIYTGSEAGYNYGHWYYWNGSAWTDGGVYNSAGVNTDTTLSVSGAPADSKATGDEVTGLKSALTSIAGHGKLLQTATPYGAGYYNDIDALTIGNTYYIEVTSTTGGTYDLAFGSTSHSSTYLVDEIGTGIVFGVNETKRFKYVPTIAATMARLWSCTSWTLKVYDSVSAWDEIGNIEDDIDGLEEHKDEIDDFITRNFDAYSAKNMIDESMCEENTRYVNGVSQSSESYNATNKMSLRNGEKIRFTYLRDDNRHFAKMWYFNVFSSDGTTFVSYDNTGLDEYTATSNCQVLFSWKKDYTKPFASIMPFNETYYDIYGFYYVSKEAKKIVPSTSKVWACVGDSMTAVGTSANVHYFDYIANDLGLTVLNYGVGGTGYAAKKDENKAFYQRILSITDDFDFLTILGSVNDISLISTMTLGTYTDSGTNTIAGCINTALDNFFTIAPFKQIGIISQPPSVGSTPNGTLIGTNAQAYNDLLKQICANRGIPFFDLFNCSSLRPWNADYRGEFYNEDGVQDSGVHPNSKGHKLIADRIYDFVKSLYMP